MNTPNVSQKRIMLTSFFGGIAWGVGSVIGATIVVAILIWLLQSVNWIPFIGDFANEVNKTIKDKTIETTKQVR